MLKNKNKVQKHNSIFFFFQAEDGIRDRNGTGVQTCALPILKGRIDLYVSSVTFAGFIALLAASRAQRIDVLDPIMIAVLVGLACLAQRVPVFLVRSS